MDDFPNMTLDNHIVKSPESTEYNCIAWACGRKDTRLWPAAAPDYEWPTGVLNENSVDALVDLFRSCGYEPCNDGVLEAGYSKVALYAWQGTPTHAARQLRSGKWSSKIGQDCEDIWHDNPSVVETDRGPRYGRVVAYMRRPRKAGS